MKSLDHRRLVVVCACALALVVFNLCNISITERARAIATVKGLGFYRETLNYVFREILLLTFCGALVGCRRAGALHRFIMQNIRIISLVSFHIHVTPLSYALAFTPPAAAGRGRACVSSARSTASPWLNPSNPSSEKTALPEMNRQRGTVKNLLSPRAKFRRGRKV